MAGIEGDMSRAGKLILSVVTVQGGSVGSERVPAGLAVVA